VLPKITGMVTNPVLEDCRRGNFKILCGLAQGAFGPAPNLAAVMLPNARSSFFYSSLKEAIYIYNLL